MRSRILAAAIDAVGAIDWDRRLFDGLIPLPDGTSYNSYLVRGDRKTALIDTVDPTQRDVLFENLRPVDAIDYVVAHHGEQDHSGSIPAVLDKYPKARVVCSPKAKGILMDLLAVPEEKFITVGDGETLSLGNLTLEFIHTPWVHWPETMVTYVKEEKILFTCDFFGSHLAQSELYVTDEDRVYEAAKRYFAEIMMPFRTAIQKNMERLKDHDIKIIAPSHGPVYGRPKFILDAYRDWISDQPKNVAVVAYVSMHGSTEKMVSRLVSALDARGVSVCQFNLADSDIGKLAAALVDAATVVLGTPAVHIGPHPKIAYAAFLANALRPKLKFAAIIGSYGWGNKIVEQIAAMIPNLKAEVLAPVICRGLPRETDFAAIDSLAETIAGKHRELGLK
jgi:flavorubredoxin